MKNKTTAATVEEFAARHRLKFSRDEDGSQIIRGRDGQLCEYDPEHLAIMFMSERFTTREGWNTRRKELLGAGMTLWLDGDFEGACVFDPCDKVQAKLAIKVAGARPKRTIDPAQLDKLKQASAQYRESLKNPL